MILCDDNKIIMNCLHMAWTWCIMRNPCEAAIVDINFAFDAHFSVQDSEHLLVCVLPYIIPHVQAHH